MRTRLLREGLDLALADFRHIARTADLRDVKPKEDQVKCALYKTLVDVGYRVHVEAASRWCQPRRSARRARGYLRPLCDVVPQRESPRTAVEPGKPP
jgi:hypothetical protein